jgi:hypothetical protein
MALVLLDIVARDRIRARQRRVDMQFALVETVRMAERLEPRRRGVLAMRQLDGAADGALAPDHPHQPDQQRGTDIECHQQRVIGRHEQETHHHLQHDREAADEQVRQHLGDDDDVEVAIEQRAVAAVVEERVAGINTAQGNLRHHARVKAPPEHIHDVDSQGVQGAGDQQQGKQAQGQYHQRRDQADVGHRVDQHLHGYRRRQRQQADADAVDDRQPVVAALRREDREEIAEQPTQGLFRNAHVIRHDSRIPN